MSDIAAEYKIHPNQIFAKRKELFEAAVGIFVQNPPDITEKAQQRRIEELKRLWRTKIQSSPRSGSCTPVRASVRRFSIPPLKSARGARFLLNPKKQ